MLPPELTREILQYLAADHAAISSCALTHRTLTPLAQGIIFRTILLNQIHHAPAFSSLLRTSPHLAKHVRLLIIAEPNPVVRWIIPATSDLAAVLDALPGLPALAVRCAPTYFDFLGDLRPALFRAARVVRALELSRIAHAPPALVFGSQLDRLRLVNVSFAAPWSVASDETAEKIVLRAPTALELCRIPTGGLSALRIDPRRLTRLRVSNVSPEIVAGLIASCARTLQALEIGPAEVTRIREALQLPALRVLAVRGDISQDALREWLRAAPGLRRLMLWAGRWKRKDIRIACEGLVAGDPGGVILPVDLVAQDAPALEIIELEFTHPLSSRNATDEKGDASRVRRPIGVLRRKDGRMVDVASVWTADGEYQCYAFFATLTKKISCIG
ncbi:hypothetical protein HDZ31DRAFT_32679 [Schizophyllum fasciatum]